MISVYAIPTYLCCIVVLMAVLSVIKKAAAKDDVDRFTGLKANNCLAMVAIFLLAIEGHNQFSVALSSVSNIFTHVSIWLLAGFAMTPFVASLYAKKVDGWDIKTAMLCGLIPAGLVTAILVRGQVIYEFFISLVK